jgi:hypothetical protein
MAVREIKKARSAWEVSAADIQEQVARPEAEA